VRLVFRQYGTEPKAKTATDRNTIQKLLHADPINGHYELVDGELKLVKPTTKSTEAST
jgi:hypothetical protein